jgi:hypothetical protein
VNSLKRLKRRDGRYSNVYLLNTDAPNKIRIGYYKTEYLKIRHIDAPGGPRITIGKTIRDTNLPIVENIEFNKIIGKYVITFKE